MILLSLLRKKFWEVDDSNGVPREPLYDGIENVKTSRNRYSCACRVQTKKGISYTISLFSRSLKYKRVYLCVGHALQLVHTLMLLDPTVARGYRFVSQHTLQYEARDHYLKAKIFLDAQEGARRCRSCKHNKEIAWIVDRSDAHAPSHAEATC